MNAEQFCLALVNRFSIKLKGQTKIVIDGEVVAKDKIRNFLIENPFDDPELDSVLVGSESKAFFSQVEDQISYAVKSKNREEYRERFESNNLLDGVELDRETLFSYRPMIDVKTGDIHMFSSKENQLADMDYDFWNNSLTKDEKEAIPKIPCLAKYDPYEIYTAKKGIYYPTVKGKEGIPVIFVNQHIPPNWRFKPDADTSCPPRIFKFLKHLFPDEECRAFFLNWLRLAIVSRNNTNLLLNSPKGTGKNILVEQGIRNLIGERNYGKAPRGFFTSNFNSVLLNKRIILIDEQRIDTPDKQDKVKDYSNPLQNVERKGKDADNAVETFHSFIILNNRETDVKIEQDDRRYAVLDVAEDRLDSVMSEEEIIELIKDFNNPELIHDFGNWILFHCADDEWTTESLYKGKKWEKLIQVSLWEWQKFILDTILSRDEEKYDIESLKSRYKRIRTSNKSNVSRDLISDFLKNYKHEGQYLGKVEKVDGAWHVIPAKKYLPDWALEKKKYKVEL